MENKLIQKAELIAKETHDLMDSIAAYDTARRQSGGYKPRQGDGSEWKTDGYGISHLVKEGLQQGATATAIQRKIITIRDHLNELRKMV